MLVNGLLLLWPNKTIAIPAPDLPNGLADGAPIIISCIPSLLTSPAAATDEPIVSPAPPPYIRIPVDWPGESVLMSTLLYM
jgi:hypothetical protein